MIGCKLYICYYFLLCFLEKLTPPKKINSYAIGRSVCNLECWKCICWLLHSRFQTLWRKEGLPPEPLRGALQPVPPSLPAQALQNILKPLIIIYTTPATCNCLIMYMYMPSNLQEVLPSSETSIHVFIILSAIC